MYLRCIVSQEISDMKYFFQVVLARIVAITQIKSNCITLFTIFKSYPMLKNAKKLQSKKKVLVSKCYS